MDGSSLRVAWLGPTPTEGGGATFVGTQLLLELARLGVEVDCFVAGASGDVAPSLEGVEGLRFFYFPKRWSWGRWYSRTPLVAFFSGHLARAKAQLALADMIVERHRSRPYDLVYQFSQSEYSPLRRRRRDLPPIVVHPSTHAAGELRWVLREAKLSRRTEPLARRVAVTLMLAVRTGVQRVELPKADRVLGVSEKFTELMAADYHIPAERVGVVVNPVDLARYRPREGAGDREGPIRLVFVSRISARKGVQLITELSHRLSDLEGAVRIHIFGGPTLWSNYLPLLQDLNPGIAAFEGQVSTPQLAAVYGACDALLQPALYEPFGLTVAEALASGLPVIASDEVGAVSGIDPRVCRTFRAGDLDALELAVRTTLSRLRGPERQALATIARSEAERLFSPQTVGRQLITELRIGAGPLRGDSDILQRPPLAAHPG